LARVNPQGGHIIAAGEVSAYSVCPQAWYLLWCKKVVNKSADTKGESSILGERLHSDWSRIFEESLLLINWIRYLVVLVCAMLVIFMVITSSKTPMEELFQLSFRSRGLQVIVLLLIALWVIRSFGREAKRKHKASGFSNTEVALAIDGGVLLPEREYVSFKQGLAGKPDAVVRDGELIIPIERKPLAKKLRDRYVAQLLIYMRLVEEFEGVRPPYGYLLLGPSCRRVRILNSKTKQEWIDKMLHEMRAILVGAEAKAEPHPQKCSRCEARERCNFRGDRDVL
jgi:CRISPR/Cas system-associated exonuclease Cas4 (RecB family)